MKAFTAFFVCILVSQSGYAQLKKVEKSYRNGQYSKCIELAKKAERKTNNLEALNYYRCKSYFSLFALNKNNLTYLDKSLSYYPALAKSKELVDIDFCKQIKEGLESSADSLYKVKNQGKSKQYTTILAVTFKDTIPLYAHFYFKKPPVKKTSVAHQMASSKPKASLAPSRSSIIQYSEIFQFIPYKWGGEDSSGFDCSGFVLKVMKKFGYVFNHGAKDQSELGFAVSRNELKPGDLVFFGKKYENGRCKIDHVAIAHTVTKEKLVVIHSTSKGVNIQELKDNDYWGKKILFFRNIIDQGNVNN